MTKKSKVLIVLISVVVGSLHFLITPQYNGPLRLFVTGYLMDILLPMNLYLLLQISFRQKTTVTRSRIFGALFTLIFGTWVEFLQYKGIGFLGNTYDPIDFLMYTSGVLIGVALDYLFINSLEAV